MTPVSMRIVGHGPSTVMDDRRTFSLLTYASLVRGEQVGATPPAKFRLSLSLVSGAFARMDRKDFSLLSAIP